MEDIGNKIFVLFVVGMFLSFPFVLYSDFTQTKTFEGRLLAYSHKEWPWKSTTMVFATYSEYSITKIFEGHIICDYQYLEIGSIYRITSIGRWPHAYRTLLTIEQVGEWVES